jgi:hypothetical protein
MSGYETAGERVARRQLEAEFARSFEQQHGRRLLGPEEGADETRRLAETPYLDRRLELEQQELAGVIEHYPEEDQERALAVAFEALDELGSEPVVLFTRAELAELRATLRELRKQIVGEAE